MNLRPLLFGLLLLPHAALAAGGAGSEAPTQAGSRLQLAMTLYAGGITLGKVDLDTTIRGTQYHSVSNLETSGVVNAFWQSQIQATSAGAIAPAFHPALYDSYYTGRKEKKQEVSLTFDQTGPVRLYADPPYATTGYDVTPEQKKGTFDPLSAITAMVAGVAASGNPCDVTLPVFDGRRRYDIEVKKEKDTDVSMDNGLYKGKALLCEIRYKQLAGFKPKIIKEGAHFPAIHAWIATFPSAVTGKPYVIPLRIWADTEYGVVAGVTTAIKVDGAPVKS